MTSEIKVEETIISKRTDRSLPIIKRIDDTNLEIHAQNGKIKKVKVHTFEKMMNTLIRLGNVYHTAFGIHRDCPYDDDIETLNNSYLPEEDKGETEEGEGYEDYRWENFLELRELSERFLPYEVIIIKLRSDYWYPKIAPDAKEWYKFEGSDWFRGGNSYWFSKGYESEESSDTFKAELLPPITKRPYIKVITPFKEVSLTYRRKRTLLTYDDVLFATRALSADDHRSYGKFICLNRTVDTLELTVEFIG